MPGPDPDHPQFPSPSSLRLLTETPTTGTIQQRATSAARDETALRSRWNGRSDLKGSAT